VKRLLLVDDEPDVLDSMVMAVEDRYEVQTAVNGVAALELLNRERFDAMVLDLMMPLMGGEELLERLPRESRPPVVVVSAGADLAGVCARMGVTRCLQKPYRLAHLLAAIAGAIADDERSRGGGSCGSAGSPGHPR
jgi:DNA-binding response OmpR family regulator